MARCFAKIADFFKKKSKKVKKSQKVKK